jgi:hypothetical protein
MIADIAEKVQCEGYERNLPFGQEGSQGETHAKKFR